MTSLLSLVPAKEFPRGGLLQYDDLARQFASLGIEQASIQIEEFTDLEWEAVRCLIKGGGVFVTAYIEEFVAAIGFDPYHVHQSLVASSLDHAVTLLRGEFDPATLREAWSAYGYERHATTAGVLAWTIGPEGEHTQDILRMAMTHLNNVAFVDDLLIYTSTMALLEDVLELIANGGESLNDHPVYGPLVGTLPETTVSSIAVPAAPMQEAPQLSGEAQEDEVARVRAEVGPMPELQGMIFAVNEGAIDLAVEWPTDRPSEDAGLGMIRMAAATPEEAARANLVVTRRFEELESPIFEKPYREVLTPLPGEDVGNVASLDFRQLELSTVWGTLQRRSDVLPFFLDGE